MELEPITRQEQIIAGKDLEPITRMEKFLKEYGGGGGGVPLYRAVRCLPFLQAGYGGAVFAAEHFCGCDRTNLFDDRTPQ